MRGALPLRRDPVPPAPRGVPGGHLTLAQPFLLWRAWEFVQDGTLLARVERAGFRRYRVASAEGRSEARFQQGRLLLAEVVGVPAAGGATLGRVRLLYRSPENPYPLLADHDGPLALFGDLRGSGLSAAAKVWTADRLLARGGEAVTLLAASLLILRERPGSFRAR